MRSRDLLLLLMTVSIPLLALAPLADPPALGPPRPAAPCPTPVAGPRGVACVTGGTAAGLGPARLAEFEVPLDPNRASVAERSEEHTSELQSRQYLVCRLLLE